MPGARTTRRSSRLALAAVLSLLLGAGLLAQQPGPTLRLRDELSTMLRQARADIEKHYYDPAFHGINLATAAARSEDRLKTAATFGQGFSILSDFFAQFDDSHTVFVPPLAGRTVDYGWQMAMVGDRTLIMEVAPGSDAAARGLAPGDRVLLLNGDAPGRHNIARLDYYYHHVGLQARQRLAVLKPDGRAMTVDVITFRGLTEPNRADVLSELSELVERGRDRGAAVGDDVFVWRMTVFARPEAVDQMIAKAAHYRTLVLDLRGNGGGSTEALRELVSRIFDREVVVAVERRRDGKPERTMAKPAKNPFTGQLLVLVDSRSASAAEMFARIVQIERRGRVLGDRSAGAVMRSRLFTHRLGDMVYGLSVTVADVRMSDGGSLEKIGVEPDEIALPSASDLAAGRDTPLARALEIAGVTVTAEEAARLFK